MGRARDLINEIVDFKKLLGFSKRILLHFHETDTILGLNSDQVVYCHWLNNNSTLAQLCIMVSGILIYNIPSFTSQSQKQMRRIK